MQYLTFKTLADELCPCYVFASGQNKKGCISRLFRMDQFCLMSAMHVQFDGSLLLHHMTS
jgi:hypothetical protein